MIRFTHILDFIQTKDQDQKYITKKIKFSEIKFKLEELQNLKAKKPPCPICYEEMSYNTKIAQCIIVSGHLLCFSCKQKLEKKNVPLMASLSMEEPLEWRKIFDYIFIVF